VGHIEDPGDVIRNDLKPPRQADDLQTLPHRKASRIRETHATDRAGHKVRYGLKTPNNDATTHVVARAV
jgi:hypothetical protein